MLFYIIKHTIKVTHKNGKSRILSTKRKNSKVLDGLHKVGCINPRQLILSHLVIRNLFDMYIYIEFKITVWHYVLMYMYVIMAINMYEAGSVAEPAPNKVGAGF